MQKVNFGEIYTNEINHWLVVAEGGAGCSSCNSLGHPPTLLPIVMEKGEPKYTVGFPKPQWVCEIKPFARLIGRLDLVKVKEV